MKKRFLTALICLAFLCTLFPLAAFADSSIAVDLGKISSLRGMTGELKNGVLELTLTGYGQAKKESPAIFFPGVSVDASKYRYIKIVMKSDTTTDETSKHDIYFRTASNSAFSESKKVGVALDKTSEFVEYTFDMGAHADWSGTVTGFFYSVSGNAKGTMSIKSMAFVEGEPVKKIVLTDEEKITDLPSNTKIPAISSFAKSKKYTDAFTDVAFTDWYYEAVASAYEFGLVNGVGETTYSPYGTMTVAEAVTLASRMHSTNNGDGEAEKIAVMSSGEKWYSNYVDYAKKEGFLKDGDFDSYDRAIKRYEMVTLFAAALPEECFEALNYVTHIPDVSADKAYAKDVLMFYNAGICMGNDIYGTFNPDSNITRSEVAAIVDRIADHSHRLDKDLAVRVNPESAYYIIDDDDYVGRNTVSQSIQSGWDYDNRGGTVKSDDEPPYTLADLSKTEPVTLTRAVTVQDKGIVTLKSSVKFNSAVSGWYIEITGTNGAEVFKMYTENNKFNAVDGGNVKTFDAVIEKGKSVTYIVTADLEAKKYDLCIGNVNYGTFSFSNPNAFDIAQVRTGTTDEAVMDTTVGTIQMYCNYLLNDNIAFSAPRYDWKIEESGDMKVTAASGEYVFNGNTGKASISNSFKPASGRIAADLIMLYKEYADGAEIALTSGGNTVVAFTTKDGKMYAGGKELRSYKGDMWYMVRIIADTEKQTAEIKVSGKTVAKDIPFSTEASVIDGIKISSENNGGKSLRIDDITVQKLPVYDNYPTEPKLPEGADDYYIGINVCNLWRNGYHWGWDNISPYDENKPVLGWYDEGLPEVADWEIKFMAEHGIDFQLICWYHSGEVPMKTFYGSTPKALFSGFMNAEYSDEYGKFALLWEAANGQRPSNLADFKTRFVEFWVEYFFSDPRYMVIDNKLVMSIFGADKLKESFGNAAGVKEAFDYLRSRVKELGYDDIIIMACSGSTDSTSLKNLANMGIDAVHAYNWGTGGSSASLNQNMIHNQQKSGKGIIHNVPTVSTGFNNIAWAYTRHGQMSTENMEQVFTWIRDYALDNYEIKDESEAWKDKFVMLSTWNEYGEGTYMMPSGLNGFGYLDTVRRVFTKGDENHTDERPDNLQMARLGHLYPINREIIRPQGYYSNPEYADVIYEEKFVENGSVLWGNGNSTVSVDSDGLLKGTATNTDPILYSKMPNGNLDASKIKQIKVWVDGIVGNSVEIFWQRTDDKTWTAAKGASAKITKEGMNPVIIDVSAKTTWSGEITALRVDPITSKNSFKVEKVQYLGDLDATSVSFNGVGVLFDYTPVHTDDGDMLIPFFPDRGIGYQLACSYTWDKVNRRLTLAKNGKTIVYTMGSDKITLNGTPVTLGCTPYLEDGLPMIPLMYTVNTFGFTVNESEIDGKKNIDIITMSKETYDVITSRVPNQWEFDIEGDHEGWVLGNATATVLDGAFYGDDISHKGGLGGRHDPALTSPTLNFEANDYSKLKIRMKHEIAEEKTEANAGQFQLVVYFKSSAGGLSESRTFRANIEQSSDGEYIEYVFDLKHNDWKGIISGIRVDPFNNVPGEFWIDYIRFE